MSKAINSITIIKGHNLAQSVLSDVVTGVMLSACIWFSHKVGCMLWEIACMGIFFIWIGSKTPFSSNRIFRINSKREAIEWASSLPDDGSAAPADSKQKMFAKAGDTLVLRPSVDLTGDQHLNLLKRLKDEFAETAPGVNFVLLPTRFSLEGFDSNRCTDPEQKAIPFGWRDVIERARDSIGGGAYSENRQYELSMVGPYLDGLADEFEHLQEVCEAVGQLGLDPVHGDVLPQVGDKVLIHLGRAERWVQHTVVGYYVWKDLGGSDSLHRVFVRVRSADGYLNARMLKDVRPLISKPEGAAA